jgi:hypothetical protein
VLIASGEESSIRESRSKSGGFLSGGSLFSSTEALNGVASTTADSSVINATGNIIIDAGSATVIGSVLDADKGISVETDIGDIQVLAAKETTETYQYRKEMDVGFGDVLKTLSNPVGLLKDTVEESKDSGRVSLTIANADYLESETRTNSTQHKGSEIKAAGGVTFDSIGNINIEGSHIDADTDGDKKGALSLTAGGNVRVADVTDTYSETNKTTTGSAEVKVMVTHQAAEVAQAAVAVKDAAEQLENTRRNYKTWMQQQDTLKATLTQLETELAQGKPGVNQGDIDDLRNQIDMLRTDEAWHLANIAVASDNLVTATKNLTSQSITGAASSTTWGFNAGLSLDINASVSESQLLQSTSVGSSLSGAGVAIKTGSDGELAIAGSTIDSTGKMVLDVGSLTMQAGVSTLDSQSQSKQGNINVSQTVWGAAAGGPSISGSLSMSEQRDHSTTYTNAGLSAAETMDITTQGDASLVGANILADKGLTASIGGDLTLQSVQNLNYGSNHGAGISGGMSFDGAYTNEGGANADPEKVTRTTAVGQAGDANSVNGGVNISNGRYYDKETVLSSITSGGPVDINVKGHTGITGALIASVDDKGNDTGKLNLNTGSLSFEDLTNTHYNTSSSVALNVSTLPGDNTTAPPKGVTTPPQDSKGEDQPSGTTNLGLHSGSNYDKGKTLATVGNGNITVGGEAAEPEGLNRDVDAVDKELYSIERTKADLDLTIPNSVLETVAESVSSAVDKVAGFMSRLGTPLNIDLAEVGGKAIKQAFVGMTEMPGVSAEDANTFLKENPEVTEAIIILEIARKATAKNPESFNQVPLETQLAQLGAEVGQSVNNELVDTYGMGGPYIVNGVEVPLTPAQSVTVALGRVQRYLDNLIQQDPHKAELALVAIDAAMGGPVKAGISYVANKGFEAALGEQAAYVEDRASSYMGHFIAGNYKTVDDFDEDAAVYDGSSSLIKDGSIFVLNNILGLGTGKKNASSSSSAHSSTSNSSSNTNQADVPLTQGQRLQQDRAYHNERQKDASTELSSSGLTVQNEVTIRDKNGVIARTDIAVQGKIGDTVKVPDGFTAYDLNGNVLTEIPLDKKGRALLEIKTGNADLTPNQAICYQACSAGEAEGRGLHAARVGFRNRTAPEVVIILRDNRKS